MREISDRLENRLVPGRVLLAPALLQVDVDSVHPWVVVEDGSEVGDELITCCLRFAQACEHRGEALYLIMHPRLNGRTRRYQNVSTDVLTDTAERLNRTVFSEDT
ncbi:hypothetical protein [Haloglycomyces albus]|uniref:hypothetical protein n=1 Tax=Haloglycomyces albus TaxID=526067 RepID=UPI00046D0ADF|nr:hypothetical protein [Haloglycomyces albus]